MTDDRSALALIDLDNVVAEVVETVPHLRGHGSSDGWGPHEVMAHFLAWHGWVADCAEALAAGQTPPAVPGTIEEINTGAVARESHRSAAELAEDLKGVHQRLRTAVKQIPHADQAIWTRADGTQAATPERLAGMG